MRTRYLGLPLAGLVLLAACSGTVGGDASTTTTEPATTTTTVVTTTTAPTTTTEPTSREGLTAEAKAMIDQMLVAADAGDLERLAELALAGETVFTASFGLDLSTPAELASYWEGLEHDGEPVSEILAALLRLDMATTSAADATGAEVEIYVSPRVMHTEDPSDRVALEQALGADRVAAWFVDGMYLGWRVGVDANGDWRFFVIGD